LKTLIVNKDEEALATLKGITPKIARNIVEELTITSDNKVQNNNQVGELAKALKSLGYPNKDIENAISNIDTKKLDLSDLISDAIKYIASSCQLA
jgi:Holliday junction resolvasome RuvABC DNA-binding subunit